MGTKEQNEDRFPVRKNPRMARYDYATPGYYFITICTHQKKCLFWTDHRLNQLGQIVYDTIMQIPVHFPKNWVDRFAVMPNHVHMILVVEPGGVDTSVVVGSMKAYVTRQARRLFPGRGCGRHPITITVSEAESGMKRYCAISTPIPCDGIMIVFM